MTVRTDRPRIWLTPPILATLKARAARGTQRWLDLKALCDRPGQDWDIGIQNYALCYQVTGNLTYAGKALDLMQQSMAAGVAQVANPGHRPTMGAPAFAPPTGIHEVDGDSGYQCRSYFPAASLCLDWCATAMTAAERAALVHDLEVCAAWVWPETNPVRKGAWAVDNPGNNYFYGFLTTWLAGLALSGDSSQADGILKLALSKWDNEVLLYLNGPAAGGCLYEGTSYSVDSLSLMLMNVWAHATATGTPVYLGWLKDALTMLAQLTTPGMDALVPLGDQTKNAGGALQDAGRLPFLLGAALGLPWTKTWLDNAKPNRMQQRVNAWSEFLFYPEETAGEDYRQSWPSFAAAQGAGVVVSRSSWQPDAALVAIAAGPVRESHQDRAAGAFGISAGGDWLAGWAKTTTHSGLAQRTEDSNCVTIGGGQQQWTQDEAKIVASEDAPVYSYVRADLTGAYRGQCSAYTREYLFLKPGTLVVKDVLAGGAGAKVVFSAHAGGLRPLPDAMGYQLRGSGAQLFVAAAVPAKPVFSVVALTNDRDPGVTGYRLDLGDQGGGQFLVVFETAPLSQAGGTWRDWEVDGVAGAFSPGALVVWAKTPGPWIYAAPGAARHLILGAAPGKTYRVPGGTAVASAGGVLMFDGPASGTRIVVEAVGDGGGQDLTRRTWAVVSGQLETAAGQTIVLTGGQLVVVALPGEPGPPAVPKTRERRK